jgi:transcriptional regulator with XRE-family HTH domain
MSSEKRTTWAFFFTALKFLLNREGLTQKKLAERLNIPATVVSRWMVGARNPGVETQDQIAEVFGMDIIEFLSLGRDLIAENQGLEVMSKKLTFDEMSERNFFTVPFSDNMKLAAGEGGRIPITENAKNSVIVVHGPSVGRRSAKNLQAFRVGGPSMEPLIAQGGIVMADIGEYHKKLDNLREGHVYILCWDLDDGECAVKYLKWFEEDEIVSIESEDRFYKPVLKRIDEVVLIGKVIWAWREFPDR